MSFKSRIVQFVLLISFLCGQVVSLPTLSPNGNIGVPVNSSLTLTCTYAGLIQQGDVYVINWYKDTVYGTYGTVDYSCIKRKHFMSSDYDVTCPDLNQQSVTINRVNLVYHKSTWTCEIGVFLGGATTKCKDLATIFVNVPVTNVTVVEPVSDRINVTEGVPRRIMCKTSPCRPEATVRWYKQLNGGVEAMLNESITSAFIKNADNLTLTQSTLYYNASRNDMDYNILCKAVNTGSSIVTSTLQPQVNVFYGPSKPHTYCLSQNILNNIDDQTVNAIEADELTLVCLSDGNPHPTYTWNGHGRGNQTVRVLADLNYTCTAGNVLQPDELSSVNMSASRTVFINQLYGPKTEPTLTYRYANGQTGIIDASITVLEHASFSITCDNSSSRPLPKYQWIGLISSPIGILNISSIERSTNIDENGISYYDYICMVHNSMTNTCGDERTQFQTLNRTGRVNVLFQAKLNPVLDASIIEGKEFILTAIVDSHGSPRETYTWYYRNNATSTKTKIAKTLTHYLTNISRTDRGFYTIVATTQMDPSGQTAFNASVSEMLYLDVFYKTLVSSFVIDGQQGNVIVNENSTVLLVCTVDSNPVSSVFLWSNTNDGESQITESILTSHITHTLPGATCYDTGLYRCIGKNQYTSIPVFRENRLFVKCTPRPRYDADQNITVYKALGDSVTLNLTIIAYPEPSSDRFKWAKLNGQNETQLTDDRNVHIQTFGLETRLTLTSLSREEFGQYRLTIKYIDSMVPYIHYFYINPKGIDASVPSLAAAIGGAAGGVVALILLVVVVMVICIHRRNKAKLTVSQEQSEPYTYYNLDRRPYEDLKRDSEDNHEYGTLNMSDDTVKHNTLSTEKTYENLRLSPMLRK